MAFSACSMNYSNSEGNIFYPDNSINEDAFYGRHSDREPLIFDKKNERDIASYDQIEIEEDEFINYTVSKHDTLMLIAQKIYGDFSKWREILKLNPRRGRYLISGTTLIIKRPKSDLQDFAPKGLPYIIHRGDTLSSISLDKYGTSRKWVNIYKNNQNTIKDPNKIYAGFTIFYEPEPRLSSTF